eukprot:scaffold230398_cov35-Tisochrysis_lutea.AAC.6
MYIARRHHRGGIYLRQVRPRVRGYREPFLPVDGAREAAAFVLCFALRPILPVVRSLGFAGGLGVLPPRIGVPK